MLSLQAKGGAMFVNFTALALDAAVQEIAGVELDSGFGGED